MIDSIVDPASTAAYEGATEGELHDLSWEEKLVGMVDQRRLFPHQGTLRLEPDRIVLDGWLDIPRATIDAVDLAFTDVYSRFMAGGARGKFPSLGMLGDAGKPVIVRRTDGGEPVLYLLIGFNWVTGVARDHEWHDRLTRWLTHAV